MAYGVTPVDTSSTPIPMSSVVPDGAGAIVPLEGGPVYSGDASGNKAPASVYVKDGNDVTQGQKADSAITDSTTTNTKMSFLKGLVKIFADVWDSTNHRIHVDGSGVTQPVSGTFWQTTQPVSGTVTTNPAAATSGGSTPSHTISASGTNGTNTKGTAGTLYGFSISNSNAAARFFKLYNKATAPTVGTDTPVMTVQLPANATVIRAFPVGLNFATGIGWGLTTGIADADTGSVGTDISVDLDYK